MPNVTGEDSSRSNEDDSGEDSSVDDFVSMLLKDYSVMTETMIGGFVAFYSLPSDRQFTQL